MFFFFFFTLCPCFRLDTVHCPLSSCAVSVALLQKTSWLSCLKPDKFSVTLASCCAGQLFLNCWTCLLDSAGSTVRMTNWCVDWQYWFVCSHITDLSGDDCSYIVLIHASLQCAFKMICISKTECITTGRQNDPVLYWCSRCGREKQPCLAEFGGHHHLWGLGIQAINFILSQMFTIALRQSLKSLEIAYGHVMCHQNAPLVWVSVMRDPLICGVDTDLTHNLQLSKRCIFLCRRT